MSEFDFQALDCGLGVEVTGLAADDMFDDAVLEKLVELFHEYGLIKTSIPGFGEPHQYALASAIGEVTDRAGAPGQSKTPGMQYVSNVREDGVLGKGAIHFHHDHLFYNPPLKALMLYGIEVPESGSETHFRSAIAFYDALPDDVKARVDSIGCVHLYDHTKIAAREYRDWDPAPTPGSPTDIKPWVWRDHKTGRKALLHSQSTLDFEGIERQEGIKLYQQLTAFGEAHADEICTYRHKWKPDDLIVWNNLTIAHARLPFAKEEPRTLRRTPVI